MVFIVAASSVDHALDTLNPENRKNYNEKIFSIPGLSLNPNTKNPRKIVQNLLSKDLSEKTDINIWHDVLNNSLSKHESNNFRPLTVSQLLDILKSFENKLRALVYCHRFRTPNILLNLKEIEKKPRTSKCSVSSTISFSLGNRKIPTFSNNSRHYTRAPRLN